MQERTTYVADDGAQFERAEECQRYEFLASRVRELRDPCNPVSAAIAPHRHLVDAFLSVLERYMRDPKGQNEPLNPQELALAVESLKYLAECLRSP